MTTATWLGHSGDRARTTEAPNSSQLRSGSRGIYRTVGPQEGRQSHPVLSSRKPSRVSWTPTPEHGALAGKRLPGSSVGSRPGLPQATGHLLPFCGMSSNFRRACEQKVGRDTSRDPSWQPGRGSGSPCLPQEEGPASSQPPEPLRLALLGHTILTWPGVPLPVSSPPLPRGGTAPPGPCLACSPLLQQSAHTSLPRPRAVCLFYPPAPPELGVCGSSRCRHTS